MIWWVLGVSILATVASGALLGPSIGFTGLVLLLVSGGTTALAAPAVWNVFTDFTLSAVPVFLAMGEILIKSRVSDRLYNALAPLFYRLPGRLLHTNI